MGTQYRLKALQWNSDLNRNGVAVSELKLERPLAFFDIEATGITPRADRIVELSIVKLLPDGSRTTHTWRINPEMRIPLEATQIHGITDADVADCPTFSDLAETIDAILKDCDLAGYNITRYDVPMLTEEFLRANIKFDMDERRIVDVQRIYHRNEPRDLSAALQFYCGKLHTDAHGAEADTNATIDIFEAQLERYEELPHDVAALDEYCNPRDANWVDKTGRLKWVDNKVVLNFGRKKGTLLSDMIRDDPGFMKWMLRSDFPNDVKEIVTNAMRGQWPSPPTAQQEETQPESPQLGQTQLAL